MNEWMNEILLKEDDNHNTHWQQSVGFPRVLYYGSDQGHNILVLELLGPALDKILSFCGGRFTLKTIIMIGVQMIDRIKYIHSRGLINKDVKPNNMLMGLGDKKVCFTQSCFLLKNAH